MWQLPVARGVPFSSRHPVKPSPPLPGWSESVQTIRATSPALGMQLRGLSVHVGGFGGGFPMKWKCCLHVSVWGSLPDCACCRGHDQTSGGTSFQAVETGSQRRISKWRGVPQACSAHSRQVLAW